jgi:regulator of sigma E protease
MSLGHFFFAKLFGVKAEAFSIGFGPKLFGKQIGETEFKVAAVPLGGYVKLLGEEPGVEISPEDKYRTLQAATPGKRFWIFFGGPLFNFIFAILVFMAILIIGEPRVSTVIGRVVDGSYAQEVGLQSGDQVVAINGVPMEHYNQMALRIYESPGEESKFDILRGIQQVPMQLSFRIQAKEGFTIYGEKGHIGEIPGIFPMARSTVIGVSNPKTEAGQAGLQTGDQILEFNGQEVQSWEELDRLLGALAVGETAQFKVQSEGSEMPRTFEFEKTQEQTLTGVLWGFYPLELFVGEVVPESPAAMAGIQSGDRLARVDEVELRSFFDLREAIQDSAAADGQVTLFLERQGEVFSKTIKPSVATERAPDLERINSYTIGVVQNASAYLAPDMSIERVWNPAVLAYRGVDRMWDLTMRNFVALGKMVTGNVSMATLGGPILIGKIAGDSLERGLISFLTTMAIISIGLGIINILPIPVLDGGHLLFLGIEVIRGKPLSMRQTEVIQQVGMSLILILMVIVIRNDLARLPIFN